MSSVPMRRKRAFSTTIGCSPLTILLDWSSHSAHCPPTPFSSTTLPDCDPPLPILILIGDPVPPAIAIDIGIGTDIEPTPLTFCTTDPALDEEDDDDDEDNEADDRSEEGDEEGGGDIGQSDDEWNSGDGLGFGKCEWEEDEDEEEGSWEWEWE